MPQHDIGVAFGRDRTTVGHACHVVEDRRDDPVFDDFVSAAERMIAVVFGGGEIGGNV
jgi:chromosomal replication initiation ATPase DnaA